MTAPTLSDTERVRIARRARLKIDRITGKPVLFFPEGVLFLNTTGSAIAELCDGSRTVGEIVSTLRARYNADVDTDVHRFLSRLLDRGLLHTGPEIEVAAVSAVVEERTHRGVMDQTSRLNGQYRPLGFLAELTYKCPLHCPYCSNPTTYPSGKSELKTEEWTRVLTDAADLGVLHILFSGGEPLLRADLPTLVSTARKEGCYTNLITSAVGLTVDRARELRDSGLDSVQISFQSDEETLGDTIAGAKVHSRKREAARVVREADLPLTINVVLHRRNVDRIAEIIALAEELGAERLELANVQFYGWAFRNRTALLPTRTQLEAAEAVASNAKARLRGRMEVHYILPDYYGNRPKPCMNGWGQRYLTVNPVGDVLPCPTASEIPGLTVENVRDRSLREIWNGSEAFNRFRGIDWMPEPCRSCDQRDIDFGGCRCQAALFTGDAAVTDPACDLSPHRALLADVVESAQSMVELPVYDYRANPG